MRTWRSYRIQSGLRRWIRSGYGLVSIVASEDESLRVSGRRAHKGPRFKNVTARTVNRKIRWAGTPTLYFYPKIVFKLPFNTALSSHFSRRIALMTGCFSMVVITGLMAEGLSRPAVCQS